MLDEEIKIAGDNNVVLNDVKNSKVFIQSNTGAQILKGIFDRFHEADVILRQCMDLLFNRNVTFHWRSEENLKSVYQSIHCLGSYIEENKFFLNDTTYCTFHDYISVYEECNTALDMLTMTIASMDFDAMDSVYHNRYDNVREMMDEFYRLDPHCAYPEFADKFEAYGKQYAVTNELIEGERQKYILCE